MPKALLTGAAGGIGQATAQLLWRKGFHLVLTDRDEDLLHRTYPELPAGSTLYVLDVTNLQAWQQAVQYFAEVDILIQLAGVMRVGTFIQQPIEAWHLQLQVNLVGLAYGAWTFGRLFAERGAGHLIHLSSLAGVTAIPGIVGYTATKFGVRGLSLGLDAELRPLGVPVTVIGPGPVRTPLILNELPKPESVYTLAAGGLLESEDVAQAIWRAIRKRPREILLPFHKAMAARLISLWPALQSYAASLFESGARRRREKYLQSLPNSDTLS
ncbi:MAG: SDR family NAD(P)-dependent oxidoreductase [Bacteroidetes bacterium]|nr:MAG: SDR family NAD(P)-dependent oxidoreductase [Bacteroidota bacterium]